MVLVRHFLLFTKTKTYYFLDPQKLLHNTQDREKYIETELILKLMRLPFLNNLQYLLDYSTKITQPYYCLF